MTDHQKLLEDFRRFYEKQLPPPAKHNCDLPEFSAIMELDNLATEDPDTAWLLILELLKAPLPVNAFGALAAGPLEDLIEYHGPEVIERIELEARRNPEFRRLLGGCGKAVHRKSGRVSKEHGEPRGDDAQQVLRHGRTGASVRFARSPPVRRSSPTLKLMTVAEQLARSHELAAWIELQVDGLPGPALLKNRLASPCFVVVQEHHQAILLLLSQQHPLYAPAFALVRPVFESFVRGVWLWHCANAEELQAFSIGGRPPNMPALLKAVEQTPGYTAGQLSAIYTRSWDAMCAYTHTGAQQIQRWNSNDYIAANYSAEEINEVLGFTGTFALLATVGLATVAADDALALRALEKFGEWAE